MARVLTVTANPLLDFLAPKQLVAGKVTRSPTFAPMAAGKGINVARILQRHGHQNTAAFFAGGDTGAMLTNLVAADGMETIAINTAARMRVGFICAAAGDVAQGSLLETGFTVNKAEADALFVAIVAQIPQHDLVIISGSVPDPNLNQLYQQLCTACAAAGVPYWLDSYGPAMDRALSAEHPPLLSKPNREEYQTSEQWQRVAELHITDGGARTEIHYEQQRYILTPPPVTEVNPIGSGDSYLAGLAHGYLLGWEPLQRFAYAAACGAANAARWDVAQIGPSQELNDLAKQTVITLLPADQGSSA